MIVTESNKQTLNSCDFEYDDDEGFSPSSPFYFKSYKKEFVTNMSDLLGISRSVVLQMVDAYKLLLLDRLRQVSEERDWEEMEEVPEFSIMLPHIGEVVCIPSYTKEKGCFYLDTRFNVSETFSREIKQAFFEKKDYLKEEVEYKFADALYDKAESLLERDIFDEEE